MQGRVRTPRPACHQQAALVRPQRPAFQHVCDSRARVSRVRACATRPSRPEGCARRFASRWAGRARRRQWMALSAPSDHPMAAAGTGGARSPAAIAAAPCRLRACMPPPPPSDCFVFRGQKRYETSIFAEKNRHACDQRPSETLKSSSARKLCFTHAWPRSARCISGMGMTARVRKRVKQVYPAAPFLFTAGQEAHKTS